MQLARLFSLAVCALVACRHAGEPDAYGNFEATEVVVSAQTAGQVQRFTPVEGMRLDRGAVVAVIDTTQLALERAQVVAQRAATGARRAEVGEQLGVLAVQREIARRAYERTRRLHEQQAAAVVTYDHPDADLRVAVVRQAAAGARLRPGTRQSVPADRAEPVLDHVGSVPHVPPRVMSQFRQTAASAAVRIVVVDHDQCLRAGARTRIELERLEARLPLPPRANGRSGEAAWRHR